MTTETIEHEFRVGDTVRIAIDADDVHFDDGVTMGKVTATNSQASHFEQYINERRIEVADLNGVMDQWVRPEDLTLVEGYMSDKEALDRITEALQPNEGEWSDMPGILERISNTVEATGREVIWE